jgi:hypothetical protein
MERPYWTLGAHPAALQGLVDDRLTIHRKVEGLSNPLIREY